MRRLVIGAAMLLTLAACAVPKAGTVSGQAGNTNPPTPTPSASVASTTPPAPAPKFGQTYTWPDGNAITLTPPTPYRPSSSYIAQQVPNAKAFVVLTVTAKNGTSQPMNPYEVDLHGISGGQEAMSISDYPVIGTPSADIEPGQTLTWKVAFGVAVPGDLQVQAAIQGMNNDPHVTFTG